MNTEEVKRRADVVRIFPKQAGITRLSVGPARVSRISR